MNREISHENVVALKEVILEDKSIYMVFDYAEHDFLVRISPLIYTTWLTPLVSKLSITTLKPCAHL